MNSDVTVLGTQISLLWVVIGAAMVIFMQAGFALVETGFCRAKHAAHVVSTNFAVFGLGFVAFFFVGFPLAFGGFSYGALGLDKPVGEALIGSGNWVFAWGGGWALSGPNITPALLDNPLCFANSTRWVSWVSRQLRLTCPQDICWRVDTRWRRSTG